MMNQKETIDAQCNQFKTYEKRGAVPLGPWTSHIWRTDPRHLGFLLARYKFCAKMLDGKEDVLEVGCGDAFGMKVVLQTVKSIHGIDFEPLVIADAQNRLEDEDLDRCSFSVVNILKTPVKKKFDAVYSLDVIEHIPPESEECFMANLCASLKSSGVAIIGTPNIKAKKYASPDSVAGHINLKSMESLKKTMERYFENVFMFGMNDEVLHTGYNPMCHYILSVATGLKK